MDQLLSVPRRALLSRLGAFVLATSIPAGSRMARAASGPFAPNAFIRVPPEGKVTLVMRDVEMGQGIWTAASMLLAEELEVGLDQIAPEFAPPNEALYASPILRTQATGGSTSIRGNWEDLRRSAAIARIMLVAAAAAEWGVDPLSCTVERGVIRHAASGRSGSYGSVASLAAGQPVPAAVTLKPRAQWKLIGTPQKRLDTPAKVTGGTVYGIDVQVLGMKVASVAMCPVLGGKLLRVDGEAAKRLPGVVAVLTLADGVAVVADHFGAAKAGLEALHVEWDRGPNATVSQEAIVDGHRKAAAGKGIVARAEGNAAGAIAGARTKLDAVYQLPFLAHAPMEPINCTVHVRPDGVDVWCGTQVPGRAQDEAARAAGVAKDQVTIHSHMIGGGFGRRLEAEYVGIATLLAKQVPFPLKMIWSRETDIQRDRYRPFYYDQVSAGLDAAGRLVGWTHKITGSSVMSRWAPPAMRGNGIDPDAVECAEETPYDFPTHHVSWVRHEPPGVVTAFWRGVGPAHNVFVVESFIDELALAAKQDPVAFRRGMLSKNPRAMRVLDVAADNSGWGTPLHKGLGRGVMVANAFGSFIAVVCEAEVTPGGDPRLRRITVAIDCGQVINPDSVRAQIEGGLVFGMSAALYGEVTLRQGEVQQQNFNDYRVLRIDETPPIDIHVVESSDRPGGLGEVGTMAAFPAVANAIFAASGKRSRRLPLTSTQVV